MSSRRMSTRESERIRSIGDAAGSEWIRSSDFSNALTEVLLEETCLPHSSANSDRKGFQGKKVAPRTNSSSLTGSEGRDHPPKKMKTAGVDPKSNSDGGAAKPFHWQFCHSKDCPITEDSESVAHLVRQFNPSGCPLTVLQNMMECDAYVKKDVAHAKANNVFTATMEKCLQDVPRSDELYEIKKVVPEVVGNKRKSALKQVSSLEAQIESSAIEQADDLCRATYEAKKLLADSYMDVLMSLKEKWEKKGQSQLQTRLREKWEKKGQSQLQTRLREVMMNINLLKEIMNNNLYPLLSHVRAKEIKLGAELEVAAVSNFTVGKLDLPEVSEDVPEVLSVVPLDVILERSSPIKISQFFFMTVDIDEVMRI
ncbi:hypothetical protein N665_0067s0007, partial [Sinapis alba]